MSKTDDENYKCTWLFWSKELISLSWFGICRKIRLWRMAGWEWGEEVSIKMAVNS